jgi:KDO2-lipid IV(A) lauroyltransferase
LKKKNKKKNKPFRWIAYRLGRMAIASCDFWAKVMPLSFLYQFARVFGTIGYALAFKQRRIALESLTQAFGQEKSSAEIRGIARECFCAMATSAIEFFMFMKHPERIKQFVEIDGLKHLDHALSMGKGVVALSGHFGNFPLLLSRLAMEGYKVNSVLRHMRDEMLDKYFEKRRNRMQVGSIYTQPRKQCVSESLKALRNKEIVFVQMDQNFHTGGVFVDFFGLKAATATGPIVFSIRTGAPIVPMFIYRVKGPRHKIVIEPPFDVDMKGTKEEGIISAVARFTKLIENYARRYPYEWGWIHKRWKGRPKQQGQA